MGFAPLTAPSAPGSPWRSGGVYLITGGAGGLGLIFAKAIAGETGRVTLILTGRSDLDSERRQAMEAIEALGARVDYRAVDITDRQAVAALLVAIVGDYGQLTGILHSAGVLEDQWIIKKNRQDFSRVLAPKVSGTAILDEASRDLPLDVFILFSSIAGALGNAGQSDYATANAFMDHYAQYRNQLVAQGRCSGRTLSIAWPLWAEGGMSVAAATERLLETTLGMVAMETASGIAALYHSLAGDGSQVMVLSGDGRRIRQTLLAETTASAPDDSRLEELETVIDGEGLYDQVEQALLQQISTTLKIPTTELDVDTPLDDYGFDSITFTELINRLNQQYSLSLTPTVLFEYSTVAAFARYLSDEHSAALVAALAVATKAPAVAPPVASPTATSPPVGRAARRRFVAGHAPTAEAFAPEPIAIIGLSGRFPEAETLDDFWHNLREGRDCIREIPPSRWDWQALYGDPQTEANKSNIKWGGLIGAIDHFDPLFFGISPREAQLMDPQQRLLMEYVWRVIEDAGYSAASLSGSQTGLFVGTIKSG